MSLLQPAARSPDQGGCARSWDEPRVVRAMCPPEPYGSILSWVLRAQADDLGVEGVVTAATPSLALPLLLLLTISPMRGWGIRSVGVKGR